MEAFHLCHPLASASERTLELKKRYARGFAAYLAASLLFCGSAAAQKPASNLDELQFRYESHLSLVNRPLTDLGEKYQLALIDLQKDLQAKASLDGLITVRRELTRFAKDRSPATEVSKVEALSRLQKIYGTQYEVKRIELKDDLTDSYTAYRGQLASLMQRLTTAGNVDEAVKVRNAIKQLGTDPEGKPTLKTGLVLHWRFESEKGELIRDASGAGNHGHLIGDASNHSTGENRGSYAVLDGSGDFIECAHSDSLTLTTDGSISLWIRPKRLQSMRGLVSKYNPNKSYTLRTWKEGSHRKIAFGDTRDSLISAAELRENRWSHVVMTLDDGMVRFFFDGKLDSEGRRSAPLTTNTNPVRIGNDYDGRYFRGAIDDVRIYKRALSSKEVAEIFKIES